MTCSGFEERRRVREERRRRAVEAVVAHAREGAKVFLAGRTRESLDELGKAATFMASDGVGPMTATFANITCGANLD